MELMKKQKAEVAKVEPNSNEVEVLEPEQINLTQSITIKEKLDILGESLRRGELTRLAELDIVPAKLLNLQPLEEDIINNIRLYRITEMVYKKGEQVTNKFATVFNTLSTYETSIFIIIDADGQKTDFYLGVRSNDDFRSTVTLGETLKNTLIGHFPGVKIEQKDRKTIANISNKIMQQNNIASVSVVGNSKFEQEQTNEEFAQGIEKLALAMQGKKYTGVILAEKQSPENIQNLRQHYQDLYTNWSPYQKIQTSESEQRTKKFSELDKTQKSVLIGKTVLGSVGAIGGAVIGSVVAGPTGAMVGTQLGGGIVKPITDLLDSLSPIETISKSSSTTVENKTVTDMLELLDESLDRLKELDSYGMWNIAGYFLSDDMSAAEIAASNYRSLMNGEKSGRQVSAINSWRNKETAQFNELSKYLAYYIHPRFIYGGLAYTTAATSISGKELGLQLGLPRTSVPGLPVIEHAEFGKEVTSYQLFPKSSSIRPEDKITLGKIFDLGQVTNKVVELDNKSLNMHTFITGSTGSGKSNAVYQILTELRQDKIPFLVIEPAKGEYKDVFGNYPDVNVFSTSANVAPLININPFQFPDSIEVTEHIDGLVEIFSVCWTMYDAMPAFFKNAIISAYESVGWDLGTSTFEGNTKEYPDFEVLAEQLEYLIENSDYHAEVKSNYRGALLTRVNSLTIGTNKHIFTQNQTPYPKIFDENCILDLSRIKSSETRALIMGLMVYLLNEYRMDQKVISNQGLKHITVLEEAHNLLKNTQVGSQSELIGKSVEMLTNTIAEIRTYGEGFIIVDQSPSAVDIAAIKNTNTKIVLRTPEGNDRELVGKSMGLTEDQITEISKLPSGVAVVYQNDWINPVLTLIDKAAVNDNATYNPKYLSKIRTLRESRTYILDMLLTPWLGTRKVSKNELLECLHTLDVPRITRAQIKELIDVYVQHTGYLIWKVTDIPNLQTIIKNILNLSDNEFNRILTNGNPDDLRKFVKNKTTGFENSEIDEICNILTKASEISG